MVIQISSYFPLKLNIKTYVECCRMHNVYKLHIKLGNLKALYFVFQAVLAVYWDKPAYLLRKHQQTVKSTDERENRHEGRGKNPTWNEILVKRTTVVPSHLDIFKNHDHMYSVQL